MKLISRWGILISLVLLLGAGFFGDLGGVGGYDGVAPKWLYDKIMFGPESTLPDLFANLSIGFMVLGILVFLITLLAYLYMFGVLVRRKINDL